MPLDPDTLDLPLDGLCVLDLSQFLAGPVCALRLADLGADVTKVERPDGGDLCRQLVVADQRLGANSLLFHTINRNKKSVAANLKEKSDLDQIKALVANADVLIHNFRPGVMERIGLDYATVSALNPTIVYGVVSGYGTQGIWRDKPGQDLLIQARSGLAWLTGNQDDAPIPMGISITDIASGMHLAQGILAALYRRAMRNKGALVEVSLLASAIDLQFEQFTSYLNGTGELPTRSAVNGANVNATAPYGLYETANGHIAIAMASIEQLQELLDIAALTPYTDPNMAYSRRDDIKRILNAKLLTQNSAHWLDLLEPAGIWAAEVLDWTSLQSTGVLDDLGVVQSVTGAQGQTFNTTTCPIRLDGHTISSARGAPELGADNTLVIHT